MFSDIIWYYLLRLWFYDADFEEGKPLTAQLHRPRGILGVLRGTDKNTGFPNLEDRILESIQIGALLQT